MIGERVLLNYTYKYGRNIEVEVGSDTCYTNNLKNEKKNNELSAF